MLFSQSVREIMKSIKNLKNDAAKKEGSKNKMPGEVKTKVISKWEDKAK